MNNLGIYVHWPFCIKKCPYCDFNSYQNQNYVSNDWLKAYTNQINFFYNFFNKNNINEKKLSSIFFGGGTPSLMEPVIIEKIIEKAYKLFGFKKNIEITLEANPSSLEFKNIVDFKHSGVNRISLGVQALNDKDLNFLGRVHNFIDVKKTLNLVLKNFSNVSVDLIYGLPKQKLTSWEKQLNAFLKKFELQHVSAYQLTIEKGTKFYDLYKKKKLNHLPNEKSIRFYNITKNLLSFNNFMQYEISNYSKSNQQSIHNNLYWKSENWLGIGPGAVSRIWKNNCKRLEFENYKKPSSWLKNALSKNQSFKNFYELEKRILNDEILMMGLRLNDGIEINKFQNNDFMTTNIFKKLLEKKIIHLNSNRLYVDEKHLIKLNVILEKFMHSY